MPALYSCDDKTLWRILFLAHEWLEMPENVREIVLEHGTEELLPEHRRYMGKVFKISKEHYRRADNLWSELARKQRNIEAAKYRAERAAMVGGVLTERHKRMIWEIQNGRCYYSGEILSISPKNYHLEHICPIASGGTYWPENMAYVLAELNSRKGWHSRESLDEFLLERYGIASIQEQASEQLRQDRERENLTEDAVRALMTDIAAINAALRGYSEAGNIRLEYCKESDELTLTVGIKKIELAPGLMRSRKKFLSASYYMEIAKSHV